jgi:EAL domain-containing protein (putative c-di-GMP-specific phosphodiesterase class I)
VLRQAIGDCVSWQAAGFELSVAVNMAAPVLVTDQVLEKVVGLLNEHDLPPARLTLEVTESTAMQNADGVIELLGRLRLRGVTLSLDDFRTGFSNLSLLHRMPFNELKIDRSFVIDVKENHTSQVIVEALAGLAHKLGLTVVAEGVEDVAVWSWIHSLGIAQAQGHGIARPMAAPHVLDWLTRYKPVELTNRSHGVA